MAFLTFPIRNEQPVTQFARFFAIFARPGSPPAASALPSFSCFRQSIVSQRRLVLTLFIYIPSAITMVAISDFILSVLWGLQPYCPLFCVNFTAAPPKKTACSCCCYLYLAYFCPKVINCYSVCAMFADTMDSFNECEMAVCHELHSAPDTPDTLVDGITFYATSSNSFGIYLCLASHPLVSVFFTLCRKKSSLVACKIYIFLTFAY